MYTYRRAIKAFQFDGTIASAQNISAAFPKLKTHHSTIKTTPNIDDWALEEWAIYFDDSTYCVVNPAEYIVEQSDESFIIYSEEEFNELFERKWY